MKWQVNEKLLLERRESISAKKLYMAYPHCDGKMFNFRWRLRSTSIWSIYEKLIDYQTFFRSYLEVNISSYAKTGVGGWKYDPINVEHTIGESEHKDSNKNDPAQHSS